MLDPFRGIGDELMRLIDDKQYFVIHAARQSGKTTLLQALADKISAKGDYYALYCSLETAGIFTEPEKGIPSIVKRLKSAFSDYDMPDGFAENANYADVADILRTSLVKYCRTLDKPLIILFDEADCLSNGTLISFLRQLRDGYVSRGRVPFVHSVALVGMRNLRDYKAQVRPESTTLESASPFNIAKEYINLRNFTGEEVAELYAQHAAETGQIFEPQAMEYAFEQTQGQPWLVNAIACECVEKITKKNYSQPITQTLIEQSIQNIILARGTHFDSLIRKLREPRIRNIIEPLILGEEAGDKLSDDYMYTRDLGLIREINRRAQPANPIYAELIVRALSWNVQDSITETHKECEPPRYLKDGKLDMDFLIEDFQQYWRENSDIWVKRYEKDLYQYNEAAAHLVIQAFLQRVINGGGYIMREMALGTGRADLCVVYDEHKYPIELKIKQSIRNQSKKYEQIVEYMDKIGSNTGWLVIFDRDTEKCWDEKIYMKTENINGKTITVAGC
jgi:hypothetical protein